MDVNTGLPEDARRGIAEGLSRLLADIYTLYIKTQGYHWNVTGSMFPVLHAMFEEQQVDLRGAADVIAERIRALGHVAPGRYGEFSKLSSVEDTSDTPDAMEMVCRLAAGHEAVIATARSLVEVAEAVEDVATADLATQRIDTHEKTAWRLRATAD